MKLVKPSFEIWEQKPRQIIIPADMEIGPKMWRAELLQSVYKQIEKAGRICYRSEDKITEDSAKDFVDRMVKLGHGSMLEHGTVYLMIPITTETSYRIDNYKNNKYSKTRISPDLQNYYIVSNFRVLVENNWLDDLQYICEPTEHHEKRITVHFTLDRATSHEFVRHRSMSFAQESQRYCNYSKNKYNNEVTFIIPCWLNIEEGQYIHDVDSDKDGQWWGWKDGIQNIHIPQEWNKTTFSDRQLFMTFCTSSEDQYLKLIQQGWKPQQARIVLNNACKTELVMTGYTSDWSHFFKLRCPESAHPSARELAVPLYEEFIKRGYVKEN